MKKLLIVIAFSLFLSTQMFGADKQFGVGLGVGTFNMGLSAKYNLGGNTAIQGLLGARGSDGFALGVDFIINMPPSLLKNRDVSLDWYAGVGAAIWSYNGRHNSRDENWNTFAISGVVGLSLMLQKVPLEFALEWRPSFYISGADSWYDDGRDGLYLVEFGGSIRWFF